MLAGVEVYGQGLVNVAKVIVDTETGVNYLMASHNKSNGTGLTVLVDQKGKPVVTPVNETRFLRACSRAEHTDALFAAQQRDYSAKT